MTTGSGQRIAIECALADYQRSPGRYALIRKEPQLLFSCVTEVLQLASGRSTDGGLNTAPSTAVQHAACFFIRSALLHPGANHYALLGLEHSADAAALKDRYRLMMRLIHPDFSSDAPWPADAASRVNQAYELLSSPVSRAGYDAKLHPPATNGAARAEVRTVNIKAAAGKPTAEDPRRRLKKLALVFGGIGGLALAAGLMAISSADKESLVQRAPPAAGGKPSSVAMAAWAPRRPSADKSAPAPTADPVPAPLDASPEPPPAVPLLASSPPTLTQFASQQERAARTSNPPAAHLAQAPARPVAGPATSPAAPAQAPYTTAPAAPLLAPAQAAPGTAAARPAMDYPPPQIAPSAVAVMAPLAGPAVRPEAPPVAQAVALPAAAAPTVKAPVNPGVTLEEVHPLLSKLLLQVESGLGDRMLGLLDREARASPGAQALLAHYNDLVEGTRPVKLSRIQFKSEPRDGRLLVTGHVLVHVRDQASGRPPKQLSLQAEFVQRGGTVVMTSLVRAQE